MIKFVNEEHKSVMYQTLKSCNQIDFNKEKVRDNGFTAAVYILSCHKEMREECLKYCINDDTNNYINFSKIFESKYLCSSHEILVKLANALYLRSGEFEIMNFIGRCDEELFEVGLEAMRIFRRSCNLGELL